jgi:hypothetical protein
LKDTAVLPIRWLQALEDDAVQSTLSQHCQQPSLAVPENPGVPAGVKALGATAAHLWKESALLKVSESIVKQGNKNLHELVEGKAGGGPLAEPPLPRILGGLARPLAYLLMGRARNQDLTVAAVKQLSQMFVFEALDG